MSILTHSILPAAAQVLLAELEALSYDQRESAWRALGDLVHDCAECAPAETIDAEMAGASWINNQGFVAQLAYLFEHNPPEFEADVREAAGLAEVADPDLDRRYGMIVAISADEVALLRRCDVARVVEAAQDAGLPGFPAWLALARPDLAAEISACRELASQT